MKPIVFLTFMKDIDSASFWEPDCSSLCTLRAVRVIVDCLCQRHTLKKLVPETCASRFVPETCMCVNQSGTSFSFASFLHSVANSSILGQKLSGISFRLFS